MRAKTPNAVCRSVEPEIFALGLSIAAHLLVLGLTSGHMPQTPPASELVVVLRTAGEAPPGKLSEQSPTRSLQASQRETAPRKWTAMPSGSASASPASFVPEAAARARSLPGLPEELARELAGQRVQVLFSVDAQGAVADLQVSGANLPPETQSQVARLLRQLRFEPARHAGDAVPSVIGRTLCFDANGVLALASPQCEWLDDSWR